MCKSKISVISFQLNHLCISWIEYAGNVITGDPHSSLASTMDPFKTLFVARIVSSALFLSFDVVAVALDFHGLGSHEYSASFTLSSWFDALVE